MKNSKKLVIILLILGGYYIIQSINANRVASTFSANQIPLVKAIINGNLEKVKELAPKTDLKSFSSDGTPIMYIAVKKALVDKNSDVQTPRLKIITELVRAGAPYDYRGSRSLGPARIMLFQEHPAMLKAFLNGGFSPNFDYPNEKNPSPIIFEFDTNYELEVLKTLVEAGANIDPKDSQGATPATEGLRMGAKVTYYLLSKGASTDIVTKDGFSFAMRLYSRLNSQRDDIASVKMGKGSGNMPLMQERLQDLEKIRDDFFIAKGYKWPPKMTDGYINYRKKKLFKLYNGNIPANELEKLKHMKMEEN